MYTLITDSNARICQLGPMRIGVTIYQTNARINLKSSA